MSTSQLTAIAAAIAFGAVLLLVMIDPRKPSRRPAPIRRGRRADRPMMEPAAVPSVLHREPRWYHRVGVASGLGFMILVIGFFVALGVAVLLVAAFLLLRELG